MFKTEKTHKIKNSRLFLDILISFDITTVEIL